MTPVKDAFSNLHNHTEFSQLDGLGKVDGYVKAALEVGQPAIATSEHGTMRGIYDLAKKTKGTALKPIYGVEFYVATDMRRKGLTDDERLQITAGLKKPDHREAIKAYEEREGIRDRWHLTAWARDDEGLRNLYRLTSASWQEGFYYKPRIDLPELFKCKRGVTVSTGCLNSPISDRLVSGRREEALRIAGQLHDEFGENLLIEVQPHAIEENGRRLQEEVNRFALELREEFGARLVGCQDSHYIHEGDHEAHEVLLCIGTASNLSDPKRFKFNGTDFHFRTREQMRAAFEDAHPYMGESLIREALDTTVEFAENCTASITLDPLKCLLPPVELPPEFAGNEFEWLRQLCVKGWRWREIPARAARMAAKKSCPSDDMVRAYKERLRHELEALRRQKFVGYILIVRDLYEWVRREGIACGPGRGSAAGSLVSYLLGITAVDPIEHGLMFERFISPSRVDMPDVDGDFCVRERGRIISHLREQYGSDRVAQIATIGRLTGKSCVQSVCRVLEIPFQEANAVTEEIMHRSLGDERVYNCVEDSFAESEILQAFDAKHPDVLRHARVLEGMMKNPGIHAAGVVISPVPLTDVVPLETRKDPETGEYTVTCTAIDMTGCAEFGLLKMDILGLRTMTVISDAVKEIAAGLGVQLDMENLDLDLPEVLDVFTRGDFTAIFQYDTSPARKLCEGVVFDRFEDVATFTALNRPGTADSGLAAAFVARKREPEKLREEMFHPKVSAIASDTLGVFVYQEHIIRICQEVAGYSAADADGVRKKIGKRLGVEVMEKERDQFVARCASATPDMPAEKANELWTAIAAAGAYTFNKAHATAYGMVAYWTAYLKTHFPLEFYWALLRSEPERDTIQLYARDAARHGVQVRPPDINASKKGFAIDRASGTIVGSILDIKGIGDGAAEAIIAGQPYRSFGDFVARTEKRRANRRAVEALVRSSAMDSLGINPRWLLGDFEELWETVGKLASGPGGAEAADALIAQGAAEEHYDEEERMLVAMEVNPLGAGKHPLDAYDRVLQEIRAPLVEPADPFPWEEHARGAWVLGTVDDLKIRHVGDYDDEEPDAAEKERMGWGKQYATLTLAGRAGGLRVKLEWSEWERMRGTFEQSKGAPVVALCSIDAGRKSAKVRAAVDLETLRQTIATARPPDAFEAVLLGRHPARTYPWQTDAERERASRDIRDLAREARREGRDTFRAVAMVASAKQKPDKRGNQMGFVQLLGDAGMVEALCFSSVWGVVGDHIQPGRLFDFELRVDRGVYFIEGGLRWLKRTAQAA